MSNFYAVKKGRIPGIYLNWNDCKKQTDKFSGPVFKKFSTKAEAEKFILNDCENIVKDKERNKDIEESKEEEQNTDTEESDKHFLGDNQNIPKISKILHVDGGHGKYSGDEGWGRVTDDKGRDILVQFEDIDGIKPYDGIKYRDVILPIGKSRILVSKFSDVTSQQNNGAEMLALITGLNIACILNKKYPGIITKICSDSDLMVKYWSINLKNEKRRTMDPNKVKFIDVMISLRKQFEKLGGTIEKISGDDNSSDLGYH